MTVLVKGDSVSFEREDGHVLELPKHYVILHDTKGDYLRRCNFYIVPFDFSPCKVCEVRRDWIEEAKRYYGQDQELAYGQIRMLNGKWQKLADVTAIRYWREGEYAVDNGEEGYRHEYKEGRYPTTQPLMYLPSRKAYHIMSPDGCVADHTGFRVP